MSIRVVSQVGYAIGFWLMTCTVGRAKEPVYLTLNPERMLYARAVEQQAIAANDSLLLAEAWYLYGKTYVLAGDYRTAQAYFVKSLRVHEPRGDSFELSRLYVRLSENEERLGHTDKSLRFANRSLAIARRIHSDKALIRAYGALGDIYASLWDGNLTGNQRTYTRILAYYKKTEELCYKLHDTLGIAEASVDLGALFTRVKDPQAVPYLEKALRLFVLLDEDGVRVKAMAHLSAAYRMTGRYPLAFQTLQNAEQFYINRKLNEYDIRLLLERNYVNYYTAKREWKSAFEHAQKLAALEKNQLLADNDGAITRLNIEYETGKKEVLLKAQKRELALRLETLTTQQRFTIVTLMLFVIAVGMSLTFFRLNLKSQRISRRNEELVKEQNHRVKNNLQVVSSLLSLQSKRLTDEAARTAVEESRLRVQSMAILHQRLYDGGKLAEANLDDFIREVVVGVLKAYGYPSVHPRFAIDNITLSADKAVPLGLILNELTTNACKYALPDNDNPEFSVTCHRKATKIQFTVTDNGPGLERSDVSGPDYSAADTSKNGWADQSVVSTAASTLPVSFGMQLIQAQVEQLGGISTFGSPITGRGVVFTLEFKG